MNTPKFFKLLPIYSVAYLISTLIYLSLFWTHFFDSYDYIFFKYLIFMFISIIAIFLLLFIFKKLSIFGCNILIIQDMLLICLATFTINWSLTGLVPFNVSRSNSIILLEFLYHSDSPKTKAVIKDYVEKKYFDKYDAIGIRLEEQVRAGNFSRIGDEYVITPKGRFVANQMRFISSLFNLKNNFLSESDSNTR